MIRRLIMAQALAIALGAAAIGSVAAVGPQRGCPDGFGAMTIEAFRTDLNSAAFIASLPPEGQALATDILAFVNTSDWVAIGEKIDGNDDRILCLKQKPKTPGNLFGWVFNAIDNTSNHPVD